MDFAVVLLIIAVVLIIAAIVWLIWIKLPEHQTMIYERRLHAEAEYDARLMSSAKLMTFNGVGYLTIGVNDQGRILYEPIIVTAEVSAGRVIHDASEVAAHNDAVQLVSDSINAHGGDDKKLLTADEWQAQGHRRDDWQAAAAWLAKDGLTRVVIGGSNPGTYTSRSNLADCMLALAIHGLPPRPQVVDDPIAAKRGNMGT